MVRSFDPVLRTTWCSDNYNSVWEQTTTIDSGNSKSSSAKSILEFGALGANGAKNKQFLLRDAHAWYNYYDKTSVDLSVTRSFVTKRIA